MPKKGYGTIITKNSNPRLSPALGLVVLAVALFCFQPQSQAADTVESLYPGLSTGLLDSASLEDLAEGVLMESGSLVVNEPALMAQLEKYDAGLRSQLEHNLFFLLEQEATRQILLNEAKAAGVAGQELDENKIIGLHLESIAAQVKVTDQEVKAFYDGNQEMVGGAPLEQVREPIRGLLLQQKKQAAIDDYIKNLGRNRPIKLHRAWVAKQYALAVDNPVDKARQSGLPSMIEFGASGCVPCDMMQPILDSLRAKFGPKLNVVFVQVREQPVLGARFGIQSIPVQVFYDAQGREVYRHEGFFPEEKIIPILKGLGLG
jgi:thiol-disulfide isomerase/thioredoxin